MSDQGSLSEGEVMRRVVASLESQGYAVTEEPGASMFPVDLGGYRPDMIARRGDETLVIEVKRTAEQQPIDRLKQIAAEVATQPGWRFVLITSEDVSGPLNAVEPSWGDLVTRRDSAHALISGGQNEGGFLLLWIALEAAMRRRAREIHLVAERLPISQLIKHLFSHGEVSMHTFDRLFQLLELRNRLAHGYVVDDLGAAAGALMALFDEILDEWPAQESTDAASQLP